VQTADDRLLQPTCERVLEAVKLFDEENAATEEVLTWLFRQLPQNIHESQILLKVAAINQLYFTNIFDVGSVAKQIAKLDIDSKLDAGSLELVDTIARVRLGENKQFMFRSFASKYCSWHRPEGYAIYDSRARECLWAYKRQFNLSFARDSLWEYIPFFDAVKEFRDRFDLHPLSFKQLDKFLYQEGKALIDAQKRTKNATTPARASQSSAASNPS
jgi:hypothetical protein